MTPTNLYIRTYGDSSNWVDVETSIILFIYKLVKANVILVVKTVLKKPSIPLIEISLENLNFETTPIPEPATLVIWPVLVSERRTVAGLCSVARSLIKISDLSDIRDLLGFREACLLSCSETSTWTRFCEIDIIETTKDILKNKYNKEKTFFIPPDMLRFEYHLSTPARIHNVYKVARKFNSQTEMHSFSEGPQMTLSDIILYQCYEVLLKNSPNNLLEKLPLTAIWFGKMENTLSAKKIRITQKKIASTQIIESNFIKQSLYKSDPVRYKPEKRIYTKQNDLEESFELLKNIYPEIKNNKTPFGMEIEFDWSKIPLAANPNGGALPKTRAGRKSEQLENLSKAVMKIAKKNEYKIVDFCSGSGHLGILLGVLLPNCQVILVENKERSLSRAEETIKKLSLTNVSLVQSNLDYFDGDFDIGVALHACGVATDLVIQNCVEKKAHLVVCPCCYGGVRDCHRLSYPRSERFRNSDVDLKNYLNFAHAADQTHDEDNLKTKQGYFCMDVVDTDRKFYIESFGYEVHLGKLVPHSCTYKNNLLVGLLK
ncbi:glutathione S-transferase C-terminal domain-containing protein homolog [Diorhabda sublineata]|uniref:glutathione S-transferase C-terminal domain-containing protein homolog n=1 Tax=Diorhabda sublineata TaxID=1163346 RepID=UPI0024E06480|nr:glutathione S-transferase C-terminal domain-containing protein homolog [Diorhabda sublineata]